MAEIVPAILTNDISDFRKKSAELFALSHYFSKLHIDFIDGEFLSNKTVLPQDLHFLKSPAVLMAHFMTFNPQLFFDTAKKIGFSWVIFHLEAFENPKDVSAAIEHAKKLGLKVGLAINPETPLHKAGNYLNQVNMIQVMGVHPGAQGRTFESIAIDKIKELKKLTSNVIIAVDGGIRQGLVSQVSEAGADLIIAGSSILKSGHPKEALEALVKETQKNT